MIDGVKDFLGWAFDNDSPFWVYYPVALLVAAIPIGFMILLIVKMPIEFWYIVLAVGLFYWFQKIWKRYQEDKTMTIEQKKERKARSLFGDRWKDYVDYV